MDANLEQRVRERAFQLWLGEGMHHGRDLDYWVAAECEVKGRMSAPVASIEAPAARSDAPASAAVKPKRARAAKAKR